MSKKPTLLSIQKHLKAKGRQKAFTNLAEFISHIQTTAARWQKDDWKRRENDVRDTLNIARIIGQVWFRGQRDVLHGLQPGLYRESTWKNLVKKDGSPQPASQRERLFPELFDLEHELRIDYTSFGHLLNEANQAKTPIDWYFMMQHHGLPTRLLDWTTNALAALFFAAEDYRKDLEKPREAGSVPPSPIISVWMMDAYWIADKLSENWSGPLLAWSEDAVRYVPPLESLIEKRDESQALIPNHAMPIEPPAMHPRVASQEGRFVVFGRVFDLLDEEILLDPLDSGKEIEELRLQQVKLKVADANDLLQDLAQLGVSRRTLFPDLAGLADFVFWKHFHKVRG